VAAKDKKTAVPAEGEGYGEVVKALEAVVQRLESGELSLEASLEAFEQGIGLVRRGEKLLKDAERRVEELLSGDGGTKTVPLAHRPAAAPPASPATSPRSTRDDDEDEDAPF
jgi:exodeoxyribonuclease VII small subunit